MLKSLISAVGFVSLSLVGAGHAASVSPESYDMLNGGTGSFTYRDDSYSGGTGNPAVSYSALTGGLGDLTDGVIATQNWNVTPGPYVGWWSSVVVNPQVTFKFDQAYDFTSITAYVDDSNGAGGVSLPNSIDVSGAGNFAISDPASAAPIAFVMNVTGLTSDSVTLTFNHRNAWIMVSEVRFDGTPTSAVPVPAALPLLGAGLGALGLMRARRRTSAKAA
ncbi:VPLPA-CTERM sorting domain-containing protein [Rhodobacteraceae bacterium SC52]|nr:VPLPA-CTERM sorting domain-containing protein [Rhodobacteraceae bacterium SC52]